MNPSTAQPALPAAALTAFKEFVRELSTEFDTELTRALTAAVREIQQVSNRQLLNSTYTYRLDNFPNRFYLPPYPLVSVTAITYLDTSGIRQEWTADNYDIITDTAPGYVRPVYEGTYPEARARPEPIATYICGYGTTWNMVPEDVQTVVFMRGETIYRGTDWGEMYNERLNAIHTGDEHIAYPTG